MTIEQMKQRRFEIDCRNKSGVDYPGRSAEWREWHDLGRRIEIAERQEQLALVVKQIAPVATKIIRPFIERLATHAAALMLQHNLKFEFLATGGGLAYCQSRTVACDYVLTEDAYAVFLHEAGHIVSPEGDSNQYRHLYTDKSILSPIAEIGAWRWAVSNAIFWTDEMAARLESGLRSYQRDTANLEEKRQIEVFIRESAMRAQPAPDSHEGRIARARTIRCQERLREVLARPRFDRVMCRTRELGL